MVLRRSARFVFLGVVAIATACTAASQTNGDPGGGGASDVSPSPSGAPTIGYPSTVDDAGASADAKPPSGTPGDILGTLSGSCGAVTNELTSPSPYLEEDYLAFAQGETYDKASLSAGGQKMYDIPNAGGSSQESEVMSFEILHACEGATLLKTETEIGYNNDDAGPQTITDLLVEINGKKVGVSVTRAYKPSGIPFPDSDVKALIEKKLEGVIRSSERVKAEDKWVKQILHVFAANKAEADAVVRVWPTIDAATRADTIVLLTQTTGGGFIYCDPDPPLGSECP